MPPAGDGEQPAAAAFGEQPAAALWTEPAAAFGTEPAANDGQWRHVSPLSPLLKGGFGLVAVLGYLATQFAQELVPILSPSGPRRGPDGYRPEDQGLTWALGHPLASLTILVLVLGGIVGLSALSWRFTRFRITATLVELRTGWLFRAHRQVPIDRIQAVEVSRPLLAQLFGLTQVIVQSAGGGDAHLTLAYLGLGEAQAVRRHLQDLAERSDEADLRSDAPAGANASLDVAGQVRQRTLPGDLFGYGPIEDRLVLRVPNTRLLASTALHGAFLIPLVIVLLGAAISLITSVDLILGIVLAALPGMVPALFAMGYGRIKGVLRDGNFAVFDAGRAVRITHGLTEHRTTTIPLHRVQALELVQPFWWRPMRWWLVRLNVAGTRTGIDLSAETTTALPVGSLDQAIEILLLIDPRLDRAQVKVAALGDGPAMGWQLVSPRARLLDPLGYRRNGYTISAHGLLLRTGRLRRRVTIVPHARIQSMTLHAGPLDTRLDLASLTLVSTPGPVHPRIDHLDQQEAQRLFVEQAERSRQARRRGLVLAGDPGSGVDWGIPDQEEPQ